MQCSPRKTTCAEKARLFRRHAEAESDYHLAIQALRLSIPSLQKPDGYLLEDFADSARKIVERAWEALERHTSEHGC
jgi:hypothetical protein